MSASKQSGSPSLGDIEDLIHNFLSIMMEHSMRQKDGWKVDVYLYSNIINMFPGGLQSRIMHIIRLICSLCFMAIIPIQNLCML